MGIRDAIDLANRLIAGQDPGAPALLRAYERSRRWENQAVLLGTDLANRLFSNRWLPLQAMRRLGLVGMNRILPLKQGLMRQAMGIAPYQPRFNPPHPELLDLPVMRVGAES